MPAPTRLKTEDGNYNQLGARVKAKRRERSITQEELCALLATHTNGVWNPDFKEISRLERGKRTVTDLEILVLAKILKCSPCELLVDEDNPVEVQ